MPEWTVQQLAERAGISGRTLRYYHQIGILVPDRIGANGYRYYGPTAVARLQRILLLREAGMTLSDLSSVLDAEHSVADEIAALEDHLMRLEQDRRSIDRRIESVKHTVQMRRHGRQPQMDMVLEGFNDRYEAEVTRRWGREAFEASNRWWHAKSVTQQRQFQAEAEELLAAWGRLRAAGCEPGGEAAQNHAAAHLDWFAQIPGTPVHDKNADDARAMVLGMADLYAGNSDYHPAFGGKDGAEFAAEALRLYVRES